MKKPMDLVGNLERGTQLLSLAVLASVVMVLSPVSNRADQTMEKGSSKIEKSKGSPKAAKSAPAKAETQPDSKPDKVVVTGSRIPRAVKSTGNVRETFSSVYVVDRKEIERSGAMTTADLLRKLPFVR